MSEQFPHLAQPLQLRHVTLRNRIVFGAHTANMSDNGLPGERHLGYYRERARGGAGMIVVEPVPVHPTAVLTRGNFLHSTDAIIPGFRAITDAVHAEGAVILHQLYHVGQHGDFDNSYEAAWSPSGLPSFHDSDGSHEMTEAEIEEIIESFVTAAERAQRCGFDGVELFAAYHAIIDQFWLPWSNRRTDKWGGSFENRMRCSSEIMRRIRERVGDEFVIGLAVSIDEAVPAAMQIDELCEVIAWHDERHLMDYVTCGTGSYFSFDKIIPTYPNADKLGVPFAERLTAVVRHAKVQAESHVRTPENADYVVASGQADMVSIVRGQIADPYLANKALTGRADEVRGCISCNQMCWGRRSRDYWISCLVNPSVARESAWDGDKLKPSAPPQDVLVVGAGIMGAGIAQVAAMAGHRAMLYDTRPGAADAALT
ncbi:MAG: 3-hydroxyacyl-CoA dehydrogenase NAD-binding domain-containing protein, partial [Ilumatobacteraceae bacterium]